MAVRGKKPDPRIRQFFKRYCDARLGQGSKNCSSRLLSSIYNHYIVSLRCDAKA
jgi:hypothetical protein